MSTLSPEYSLELFCYRLVAQKGSMLDPVSALDAITGEIHATRRAHQKKTKERDFRPGSKGRAYCDEMKLLVSVLVNGVVPQPVRAGFLDEVRPLVTHLLRNWDIGELRKVFT